MNCCFFFRDGKIVNLKEEDSDLETQELYRSRSKYSKGDFGVNDGREEGEKEKMVKTHYSKRRTYSKTKSEGDNNLPSNEMEVST